VIGVFCPYPARVLAKNEILAHFLEILLLIWTVCFGLTFTLNKPKPDGYEKTPIPGAPGAGVICFLLQSLHYYLRSRKWKG